MLNDHGPESLNRRDFLRAGALSAGAIGLSLTDAQAANPGAREVNCILLFLVGGPSHIDTWDLKPNAPDTIRGPFKPIKTNISGIEICEHFPLMASMADRWALLRSVHHQSAPIHETGFQMMQTGRLSKLGFEHPNYGAVVSLLKGSRSREVPASTVLPTPIGYTGVSVDRGQTAGFLDSRHCPVQRLGLPENQLAAEKPMLRDRYGRNTFGQSCLHARQLVESGVRVVTVNMFETVFNETTWDCHADGGSLSSTLDDYKETLCPMFDRAYSALLEDLQQRGMLQNTIVVAMGEFGRTPYLNPRGGRDHWPGCWSVLFAGGGVRGGQVIGSSDEMGAMPKERPISPAQVAASVYRGLGIGLETKMVGPDGRAINLVDAEAVAELSS